MTSYIDFGLPICFKMAAQYVFPRWMLDAKEQITRSKVGYRTYNMSVITDMSMDTKLYISMFCYPSSSIKYHYLRLLSIVVMGCR